LPEVINFEASGSSAIPDRLISQSRAEAAAVGYAHGWSQGLREARDSVLARHVDAHDATALFAEQREDSLRSALTAIAQVAAQIEASATPHGTQIEDQIIAAAVEIAEALVGRELRETDEAARCAIARVLELTPDGEEVRIRINAEVFASFETGELNMLLGELSESQSRRVSLEPDTSLAAADAIGHCGASVIDARLAAGIQRVREHLSE
jgi:flagellar assembly protein FliH